MTSPSATPELLVSLGRHRLGAIDVVRITPSGSATRRDSLFDRATLTHWWRAAVAPAGAVANSPRALVGGVLRRRPTS